MSVLWILAPILVLAAAEPPSIYRKGPGSPSPQFELEVQSPTFSNLRPQPTKGYYSQQQQQPSTLIPSYGPPPTQRSFYGAPDPTSAQQYHRASQLFGSPPPTSQYGLPSPSPTSFYDSPDLKTTLQPPLQQQYQAQPTQSYGVPYPQPSYNEIPGTNYGTPTGSASSYGPPESSPSYGPPTKVVKHVSVFIAPEEPSYQKTRTIRVQGEQEKHVNIIFIKSPNPPPPPKHEIELPAGPQQKTLVYVLSKNQDEAPEIKIKQSPQSSKPASPDVYFIRYKSPPKDRYGVKSSSSDNEYGSYFNSFQQSDYSNAEPILVNGPLPNDEVANYAPKMDHKSYNFISKRETAQGEKGVVDLNVADFRPYSYAPNLGYVQYQVKGY